MFGLAQRVVDAVRISTITGVPQLFFRLANGHLSISFSSFRSISFLDPRRRVPLHRFMFRAPREYGRVPM